MKANQMNNNETNDGGTSAPRAFLPQTTNANARRSARSTIYKHALTAVLGLLLAAKVPAADQFLDVGDWALDSTSRTLPAVQHKAVDIGTFTFTGGTGSLVISVNANGTSYHVGKRFIIPMRNNLYGGTTANTWLKVLPAYDTGVWGGNDFDLNIKVVNAVMNIRLLVVATDGAHSATADVVIESTGVSVVSLTTASATVTPPTAAQVFTGSVLTQIGGRVGVNIVPSSDAALDINGGDTKGLRLRPRSVAGSPTTGTWNKGTLIVDSTGALWVCTALGTPGTWKKVGP